jgi:hypothetical protein
MLYHFNYDVGRYISLECTFEQSKETYYEFLEASSQNWYIGKHGPNLWLNHFWGTLLCGGTVTEGRGAK